MSDAHVVKNTIFGDAAQGSFDHRKYSAPAPVPAFNRTWPDNRITRAPIWVSEDLRDGNQALLEPMSVEQKQRLWHLILKIGIKEVMVGFPSASQPDYDFVRWLIDENQIPEDVTIAVLVQAREHLIARTFEALQGVHRAIIHIYSSTSTIQRERVFEKTRDDIKALACQGVTWVCDYAARYPATDWRIEYSPESFSETEPEYAVDVCEAVMAIVKPTREKPIIFNLPNTVEVASPNHYADQIEYFCQNISNRDAVVVSVHTHNDRGGAVAAAELALLAGADRVEGTLLGNGERTGNMDIVTLGMNLYSQGIDPQLDLSNPEEIIRTVSECTKLIVHPRHPWVGELVYTAFSGSHQDAIRKSLRNQRPEETWQVAYLPIDPRDIGRNYETVIRVNSQSGKAGMAFLLERDHGISLPRWMMLELAPIVQKASEKTTGELSSDDIRALLFKEFSPEQPYTLEHYRFDREGSTLSTRIREGDKVHVLEGQGNGVISAFVDAWHHYDSRPLSVTNYSEHAMGSGSDAKAIAFVQLNVDGVSVTGVAEDYDTGAASLRAILAAFDRAARQKS
ncbi:2-isopropylmalate synthase [Zymobacter sp. IVIA_12111.31 C1]|uniref:2-isopropylmalate synthase n=1 Tax=Zymobacter sp. IVIA_12111.31 C1 TaxID=3394854 RepID=UPI0039C1A5BA